MVTVGQALDPTQYGMDFGVEYTTAAEAESEPMNNAEKKTIVLSIFVYFILITIFIMADKSRIQRGQDHSDKSRGQDKAELDQGMRYRSQVVEVQHQDRSPLLTSCLCPIYLNKILYMLWYLIVLLILIH